MTVQKILDSIYLIPVILDYLDNPTNATSKILKENDIDGFALNDLANMRSLLEYHMHVIGSSFHPNYPLLRQGLKEYFNVVLKPIWIRLGIYGQKEKYLLDYGCGAGQYSEEFLRVNPSCDVKMVDKDVVHLRTLVLDFEKDPDWYLNYQGEFDYVLLAEVLHCKEPNIQAYLISSSYKMLKSRGELIVVEPIDYIMAYRISKLKGQTFNVIEVVNMIQLVPPTLKLLNLIQLGKHMIYHYVRV